MLPYYVVLQARRREEGPLEEGRVQHVVDTLPEVHAADEADAVVRHVGEALGLPDELMQPRVQRSCADPDDGHVPQVADDREAVGAEHLIECNSS